VVLRIVPTPAMPVPLFDLVTSSDVAAVSYFVGGEQPVWDEALRADPVVGAFLDRSSSTDSAPPGQ
jgi:hypothetical protein